MEINNNYSTNISIAFEEIANAKRNYYSQFVLSHEPETDVFVQQIKEPDKKQRIISNLTEQRADFENEVLQYLLYMKHTSEIEPTKYIRKSILKGEKVKPTKEMLNLDVVLSRNKIPEAVTVYRCANPMDFGLPMETNDFIENFYKEGDYFRIPIYPRTSLRRGFAKQYAKACIKKDIRPIIFKINLPKGTRGIYLDDLKGEDKGIANWNEQEIVLERNRTFRFKDHTSHRYFEEIEIDKVPRWKIPFWKKIHNFGEEITINPKNKTWIKN